MPVSIPRCVSRAPPRGAICAEPRASARRRRASPGLPAIPSQESRLAGRHEFRRSALLRIPGRLNLCVSVDNGVNSTWHLPLTTVFQQLTAISWGKLLCSPLASRSATAFPHSAIASLDTGYLPCLRNLHSVDVSKQEDLDVIGF